MPAALVSLAHHRPISGHFEQSTKNIIRGGRGSQPQSIAFWGCFTTGAIPVASRKPSLMGYYLKMDQRICALVYPKIRFSSSSGGGVGVVGGGGGV